MSGDLAILHKLGDPARTQYFEESWGQEGMRPK